ncbi:MAG: hypothetical protein ACRD68_15670 [Pyrinomonadaceae bacterium]
MSSHITLADRFSHLFEAVLDRIEEALARRQERRSQNATPERQPSLKNVWRQSGQFQVADK